MQQYIARPHPDSQFTLAQTKKSEQFLHKGHITMHLMVTYSIQTLSWDTYSQNSAGSTVVLHPKHEKMLPNVMGNKPSLISSLQRRIQNFKISKSPVLPRSFMNWCTVTVHWRFRTVACQRLPPPLRLLTGWGRTATILHYSAGRHIQLDTAEVQILFIKYGTMISPHARRF